MRAFAISVLVLVPSLVLAQDTEGPLGLSSLSGMMNWVSENSGNMLQIVVLTVGLFSFIASLTPNKSDDRVMQFLLSVINRLGFNFGAARNK